MVLVLVVCYVNAGTTPTPYGSLQAQIAALTGFEHLTGQAGYKPSGYRPWISILALFGTDTTILFGVKQHTIQKVWIKSNISKKNWKMKF